MKRKSFDNLVVLMTGTIVPNGMSSCIGDVHRRKRDYFECIQYLISNNPGIKKVVFAENSGYPLDEYKRSLKMSEDQEVELLSFNINNFPAEFHKGYGENELITMATEVSGLISQSKYVVKQTGRIKIRNLSRILSAVFYQCEDFDFFCDFRDHRIYELLGLNRSGHHCDTRLFLYKPDFFLNHLSPLTKNHAIGGFSMEGEYFVAISPLADKRRVNVRFPVEPYYRGIAGHWGKNYSSPVEILKQSIRAVIRKTIPDFYI